MAKDRRCDVPGCGGWRIRGSDKCAGHDPGAQERARAAVREKAKGLGLPPLREPADAEAWIAEVGQLLPARAVGALLGIDAHGDLRQGLGPGRAGARRWGWWRIL